MSTLVSGLSCTGSSAKRSNASRLQRTLLGKPLGIPSTPVPEPTVEQIDHYHDKYLSEVKRIFETYKKFNPDYKDKTLQFE